ncbi:BAALC binder of MAP3K1 and KLF4 a [Danio rerio]|uniref:BAALC binder of MAP3K1 and KLF4 a n=1 Tax=Danio rerio TaxID=7955 RepID=B3DFT7_DANRE|nr:BAALC binder of MAP3K1 and KLF4 a [Danio rerio]AAI62160.1 Similar to BAALC [Danio rerio]AAI62163.1 Similar to BAALC [Danio rerio]|eukprot:NP_001122239.1 brain and acute leukemia cytoplasmic protein [Danio rerio]
MGCGGSRSATIEPRYYESRDTESTWLTNTDTERTAAGNGTGESAGTGTSDNDNTTTAAAGAGQREEKAVTMSRNSSVKEKRLVNAGTQCSRNTTNSQRRPSHRDTEVKSKSKKLPHADGVKNVCPAVNSEAVS